MATGKQTGGVAKTGILPSPTRTKATWKPRVAATTLPFFTLDSHGDDTVRGIMIGIDDGTATALRGEDRSPEAVLPYAFAADGQQDTSRIETIDAACVTDIVTFEICMRGGFDNNALKVRWTTTDPGQRLRWLALKTFTGLQLRYIMPDQQQPVVFGLAGDDAYAYCDKDPCEDCMFHCKRGFELYAYVEDCGIVCTPVHEPVR